METSTTSEVMDFTPQSTNKVLVDYGVLSKLIGNLKGSDLYSIKSKVSRKIQAVISIAELTSVLQEESCFFTTLQVFEEYEQEIKEQASYALAAADTAEPELIPVP